MTLDTGEELLAAAIGLDSALTQAAQTLEPFIVPYDQLARRDGWVVWLGHPPVPQGLALLPIPDHLLWDDPFATLAASAAIAADYAARRGADTPERARAILCRESPLAVVVPGHLTATLQQGLDELRQFGVPVLHSPVSSSEDLLQTVPSFSLRHAAHAQLTSQPHDPALSFQRLAVSHVIGLDARSSFVLTDNGHSDGVVIDGQFNRRLGIEIGIAENASRSHALVDLEREAALMPAFLDGVTSQFDDGALEIGWIDGAQPTAVALGSVFHVWLKALYNLDLVEVRIVFAAEDEDSTPLALMNARADEMRRQRIIGPPAVGSGPNPI